MSGSSALPPVAGEVVIVKYNAGNVYSVLCGLRRLGIEAAVTDDPQRIQAADRVIFPGVGEASSAMRYLKRAGLDKVLTSLRRPFLGICLGMQLMCSYSEENSVPCLGIYDEKVIRFPDRQKVPHMGWNTLTDISSELFAGISEEDCFYFVHSYCASVGTSAAAVCSYMVPFSAALQRENYYGVQFHPEKSGRAGERVLKNLLGLTGGPDDQVGGGEQWR
jgi:imidazole glycerol-phosphate synthase subunit HisH